MPNPLYAEVAPAIPLKSEATQVFTYLVPTHDEASLAIYALVMIPFGRRHVPGIVLDIHHRAPRYHTKPLEMVPGIVLTPQQIQFGLYLSDTMQGGLGYTLRLFTPPFGQSAVGTMPSIPRLPKLSTIAKRIVVQLRKMPVLYVEQQPRKRWAALVPTAISYVQKGQQVLILVPEKWMIPTIQKYFPALAAAAYHAGISSKRQREIWHGVSRGHIQIVIGTQKALFLPWKKLGLAILEEEQFPSHKLWDQYPRLSNCYGLELVCRFHASDLLATATLPSLAAWARVQKKTWHLVVGSQQDIAVTILAPTLLDQRQRHFLPQIFMTQLAAWHVRGKKVLVLHNRKASWAAALCRQCHQAMRCPTCAISLTVQRGKQVLLVCPQCHFRLVAPKKCLLCKKGSLHFVGPGNELVADLLRAAVPAHSQVSLDAAAIKQLKPASLQRLWRNKTVIVGTSAILRPEITAEADEVVWLFPEHTAAYPDIRSQERAYLLLSRLQAVTPTRAVTIITRQKQLIKELFRKDWSVLYTKLLKERQRLHYAPAVDMVRLTVAASTAPRAAKRAALLRTQLEARAAASAPSISLSIRGPFQSFHSHRRGLHEMHLLLAGTLSDLVPLYRQLPIDTVDLDPQRIL